MALDGWSLTGLAWGWAAFQQVGGIDSLRERVTAETAASDSTGTVQDET